MFIFMFHTVPAEQLFPFNPPPPLPPVQISYMDADGEPVAVVQLGFLRLLSIQARQNFTYHCHHSVAWTDQTAVHRYQRALHFRAANEEELSYESSPYIKALTDGCSVSFDPPKTFKTLIYSYLRNVKQ